MTDHQSFENVKIKDISDKLMLVQLLDIQLVIHKESQFINCNNLCQQLNIDKVNNLYRFFNQQHIKQKLQKAAEQQKCIHIKYSKMELGNQYAGYYISRYLYQLFIQWANPMKADEYSDLFIYYLQKQTLQNKTNVQELLVSSQEEIKQLTADKAFVAQAVQNHMTAPQVDPQAQLISISYDSLTKSTYINRRQKGDIIKPEQIQGKLIKEFNFCNGSEIFKYTKAYCRKVLGYKVYYSNYKNSDPQLIIDFITKYIQQDQQTKNNMIINRVSEIPEPFEFIVSE